MKQAEQDLLFVELKDPAGLRRDVLMSTKDVLDSLKRFEEYKVIKAAKMQVLFELKRVIDDIAALNRKLRNKLPKASIAVPDITSTREREVFTGPSPSAARPKSKLDLLQEELQKIESRLGTLE